MAGQFADAVVSQEMIDDLQRLSEEYIKETRDMRTRGYDGNSMNTFNNPGFANGLLKVSRTRTRRLLDEPTLRR